MLPQSALMHGPKRGDLHSIKSRSEEEYASRVRVQITLECRRKADHAHNADSFKLVAGAFHASLNPHPKLTQA